MKRILGAFNFLAPQYCAFCRKRLPLSAARAVCGDCENKLPFCMAAPRCSRCGKPVGAGEELCGFCAEDRASYKRISSAYCYEGAVKRALLRFKRERYRSYARVFAGHMKAVAEYDGCGGEALVVSVPPRPERLRREHYDQAECLARELARQMKLPYLAGAMAQKENRGKQSEKSYRERLENARGNFAVRKPERVAGGKILLVDDICTSRATLEACAKALREAGAAEVRCVTAATVR